MKERLDVILVSRGDMSSRERAREAILSGKVWVDGQRAVKAGTLVDPAISQISVRGGNLKYVSRGGLKLEKAVAVWDISLTGKICMDIGASTGGFTDCMLQNGASRVYAVDVGKGQLAEKLIKDRRVVNMEQTNFRYLSPEEIGDSVDFATADVSFISLTRVMLPARRILKEDGEMVCLVKPQFEAGRGKVGKKGVVREERTHREVLSRVIDYAELIGFSLLHLEYSPIKGPEGNIEYLLHLRKDVSREPLPQTEAEADGLLKVIADSGGGASHRTEWTERIARVTMEASADPFVPAGGQEEI